MTADMYRNQRNVEIEFHVKIKKETITHNAARNSRKQERICLNATGKMMLPASSVNDWWSLQDTTHKIVENITNGLTSGSEPRYNLRSRALEQTASKTQAQVSLQQNSRPIFANQVNLVDANFDAGRAIQYRPNDRRVKVQEIVDDESEEEEEEGDDKTYRCNYRRYRR